MMVVKQWNFYKKEFLAGLTTFLVMSYVLFVNPAMLATTGMDHGAVFVATCLAAALGSTLMGLIANYPIALAPGMALSAYFTYGVVAGGGYPWQTALGAVFISGCLFLLISVLPIRKHIITCIPVSLRLAIVAGIGLFLVVIGFKNAGIIVANPNTITSMGSLHHPETLLAILGFFLIIILEAMGIASAIILSILITSILSILLGITQYYGIFALPPSIMPVFFQMDIANALQIGLVSIVFAFLFVDLFDNTGTLIAIAHKAGFSDHQGKLPRMHRVLIADSAAAIFGAALGTATTTSYLESVVGVKMGGRTGLTALTVAVLFFLSIFLSPLAHSIPLFATAPALIYIGCIMLRALTELDWDDVTEYVPGLITALSMPFTFSVAEGISFGFIAYTAIKLFTGKLADLNLPLVILTLIFLLRYGFM